MAVPALLAVLITNQAVFALASESCTDRLASCESHEHDEHAALQTRLQTFLAKESRNPKWNIDTSFLEFHDTNTTIEGVKVLNADEADSSTYGSDRPYWNIVLTNGAWDETLKDLCAVADHNLDCKPLGHPTDGGMAVVEIHGTEKDLQTLFELHGLAKEIAFVEPDMPVHAIPDDVSQEPADTSSAYAASASSTPWGLEKIGVPGRTAGGRGVHVYVLDTGVRTSHNDFGSRAVPTLDSTGRSPVECNGNPSCAVDRHGHGTHCAGTVGGATHGVAHQSTIHGVKVLSDKGSGSTSGIVNAMDWVLTKGQRPAVVSMSLGGRGQSAAFRVAVDKLTNSNPGVTVVVAAGNSNADACQYSPAFVPSAITVGSSTSSMSRSSFSNYGKCLDIFAPGSSVRSTCAGSDTQTCTKSGTSMACPHVAGAAALLLENNKEWTPVQVQARMTAMALSGAISSVGTGSPNLFLKVDGEVTPTPPGATPAPPCTAPPTPAPPTPAPPTPAPC